ncbi:TPA: citrate lyase acyl carrier protein, partial [Klebsiella pneumoniae]
VDDKGALDCVLRARLETALMRAGALTLCWGEK